MLAHELKNRAIVTLADAAKVGVIDEILFDPQLRTVLGFRLKRDGIFGATEAVPHANITAIGPDALTITSRDAINAEKRFADMTGAITFSEAHGMKIVTEGGELLGTIADLALDDTAQTVAGYILNASLIDKWRHQQPEIAPGPGVRVGTGNIIIVPNDVHESVSDPNA